MRQHDPSPFVPAKAGTQQSRREPEQTATPDSRVRGNERGKTAPCETAARMRPVADLLCLWRVCGKPACRRTRRCRGDARACFPLNGKLLPEGVLAWYNGLREAQAQGVPFEQAIETLDAAEEGDAFRDWHAAVSASLGGNATLPLRWWNAL